jgi:hypothetical protein
MYAAAKSPKASRLLSAAGRKGGLAAAASRAQLKAQLAEFLAMAKPRGFKELLGEHMKHPDTKHVQSWVNKVSHILKEGQVIPEASKDLLVTPAKPKPPAAPATAKKMEPALKPPPVEIPVGGDTPDEGEEKISVHLIRGRVCKR